MNRSIISRNPSTTRSKFVSPRLRQNLRKLRLFKTSPNLCSRYIQLQSLTVHPSRLWNTRLMDNLRAFPLTTTLTRSISSRKLQTLRRGILPPVNRQQPHRKIRLRFATQLKNTIQARNQGLTFLAWLSQILTNRVDSPSFQVRIPSDLYICQKRRFRRQRKARFRPYMFIGIRAMTAARGNLFSSQATSWARGTIRRTLKNSRHRHSTGYSADKYGPPTATPSLAVPLNAHRKPRTKFRKFWRRVSKSQFLLKTPSRSKLIHSLNTLTWAWAPRDLCFNSLIRINSWPVKTKLISTKDTTAPRVQLASRAQLSFREWRRICFRLFKKRSAHKLPLFTHYSFRRRTKPFLVAASPRLSLSTICGRKRVSIGNLFKIIKITSIPNFNHVVTLMKLKPDPDIQNAPLNSIPLTLSPGAATYFSHSPFFFLQLLNLSLGSLLDRAQPRKQLARHLTYSVFPSANSIKVAIFRRFNRQKIQATKRASLLTTLTRRRSLKRHKLKNRPHVHSKPKLALLPTRATLFDASVRWSHSFLFRARSFSQYQGPRVRRIRFKPGYNRIWRTARIAVQEILGVYSKYQYRLTPKLQKMYWQSRATFSNPSYLTVEFLLLSTKLTPDFWVARELLATGTVYLNSYSCLKSETRLFANDLVQLVVHIKFYAVLKWLKNSTFRRRQRMNKIFYRKLKPTTFNRYVKTVRTLPTWFFTLSFAYGDVPRFFELDYFSLSTFVVYLPKHNSPLLPWRTAAFRYPILNMYNWKYIT